MHRRYTLVAAGVSAVLSLALAGCGSQGSSSTAASAVKSPVGNVALVALPAQVSPNWFFPVESSTAFSIYNSAVNYLMYVPLLHISKTDGIDYNRSLASGVTWNAAGSVYTISLNPKWHWSNGRQVTAQDVVFTMDVMLAASSGASNLPWGYGGAGIGGIPVRWKSVVAKGRDTVVVTLNAPSNPQWFLHNGLGSVQPVPASVWDIHKNMTKELAFIKQVSNEPNSPYYDVVDGPFKFDAAASKTNNQYWTFVPNTQYDGHKASISKLVYLYFSSSSDEFAALKTGKVNVGYLPASLYDDRTQLASDKFSTVYPFGFNYLVPNLSPKAPGDFGKILAQPYARKALEMGVDQEGIIKDLYHGQGVPGFGPIPSEPKTEFYDASLTNPASYNPAAGEKLLEKHGWKLTDGVMTKNGVKFAFTYAYVSGSNSIEDEAELLKSDWSKEGIEVTLESQPFNNLIANSAASDPTKWQMINWGGGWTYEPDYYPTGGGLFATSSASNFGGYSNKTMNALIKDTYLPGTASQITQRMDAYQAYVIQQYPVIWLPWLANFDETADYVHNVNSSFNPVLDLTSPNYWTITH